VCDRDVKGTPSIFKVIRSTVALAKMFPIVSRGVPLLHYESIK
jgi:hypothetical protein